MRAVKAVANGRRHGRVCEGHTGEVVRSRPPRHAKLRVPVGSKQRTPRGGRGTSTTRSSAWLDEHRLWGLGGHRQLGTKHVARVPAPSSPPPDGVDSEQHSRGGQRVQQTKKPRDGRPSKPKKNTEETKTGKKGKKANAGYNTQGRQQTKKATRMIGRGNARLSVPLCSIQERLGDASCRPARAAHQRHQRRPRHAAANEEGDELGDKLLLL